MDDVEPWEIVIIAIIGGIIGALITIAWQQWIDYQEPTKIECVIKTVNVK